MIGDDKMCEDVSSMKGFALGFLGLIYKNYSWKACNRFTSFTNFDS